MRSFGRYKLSPTSVYQDERQKGLGAVKPPYHVSQFRRTLKRVLRLEEL